MAGNGVSPSPRHHTHHRSDDEPDPDRRHRRRQRKRYDDSGDGYPTFVRERRERLSRHLSRRSSEVDVEELQSGRQAYYSAELERRRESQRMTQNRTTERRAVSRNGHREPRREGMRREKRRDLVQHRPSDDYVYGAPQSEAFIEEGTTRRSSAKRRSNGEGSSSRTVQSPLSGSRSPSPHTAQASKPTRSKSTRETTRAYMAVRPSVRRSNTVRLRPAPVAPSPTHHRSSKEQVQRRSTGGFLATLFGPPPRITSNTLHRDAPSSHNIECIACRSDDIPARKAAKLKCGHYMCRSCLRRVFTLSLTKPELMPPKCCTSAAIPMKHVEHLFDDQFKATWNRKLKEFSTSDRIYCPNKGCGEWIEPSKIKKDMTGRKYARCDYCHTHVCAKCNRKFHRTRCSVDLEVDEVNRMAKEKGWQRCYNCKNMVELKDGCNHMTCICKAEFCMRCAKKWRTCDCPWFNHEHIEDNYNYVEPQAPRNQAQAPTHMEAFLAQPLALRPRRGPPPLQRATQTELAQTEDALRATLHAQLELEQRSPTPRAMRSSDPAVHVNGLGNAAGHHMNDSYQFRYFAPRPIAYSAPQHTPSAPVQRRASYSARPLAVSAARAAARRSGPQEPSRHVRVRSVPAVQASTMAGLDRDGSKRGHNRVGTWVRYVQTDYEAVQTAPQDVEVDEWEVEGPMVGIP
ncbi:uncharacterized protein EI97DRAFT_243970 [Westerdykella ornata]|uniref:RBR-type E3 ubiquitin transferase n=1 Tax=Westerdykella ornata TaxID=318751 RepID=A0A6A6J604_WESOR|nr:uncharacterized protein EI97DRAFT_243970 [Westerdykella ornata]KAF2271822.1 hypothetical protein EI97DRAFT_243970 [Westerdykella ornata]